MRYKFESEIKKDLLDPEFARYFGAAQAKSGFAITLSKARIKLGLTQKEIANKAGVTQSYIAKLEGGAANPTLDRIGSLLSTINLSLVCDTSALSPYPETPIMEDNWTSEYWLTKPPIETIQFASGAPQHTEVVTL